MSTLALKNFETTTNGMGSIIGGNNIKFKLKKE